jgi:hypothetical protein
VANIDPRLIAQINNASIANNEDIKAVISLANQTMTGEKVTGNEKLANVLLSQTEDETEERPTNVKHLPRLGVLVVQGSPKFIQKLLEHPEVSSATISDNIDIEKQ